VYQDSLQIIVGILDSWEKAQAHVRELINEYLRRRGVTAFLTVRRKPANMSLDDALADLRTAIRWVELHCPRLSPRFTWLALGNVPLSLESKAAIEHQLQHLPTASVNAADPDFWRREIIEPTEKHAEEIRSWLQDSKKRALQKSLTDCARKALRVLFGQKAFDQESRIRIEDIARLAEGGKAWANPGPFRQAVPELVEKGLAATKEGRGGGAWLTANGRKVAKTIHLK
jgi:hypothetical protein